MTFENKPIGIELMRMHLYTTLCAMKLMARMLGRKDLVQITDAHLKLPQDGVKLSDVRRLQKTLLAQRMIAFVSGRADAVSAIDVDLAFIANVMLKKAVPNRMAIISSRTSLR